MYIKIEQRFWNYRVHNKRRKVEKKKRPSSYLLKELNVKFIDKSKSRATDVV